MDGKENVSSDSSRYPSGGVTVFYPIMDCALNVAIRYYTTYFCCYYYHYKKELNRFTSSKVRSTVREIWWWWWLRAGGQVFKKSVPV